MAEWDQITFQQQIWKQQLKEKEDTNG